MKQEPYKATKAFHPVTGVYRWGVWCDTSKFMQWPTTYGYKSAHKMANRLNREYKKHHQKGCCRKEGYTDRSGK